MPAARTAPISVEWPEVDRLFFAGYSDAELHREVNSTFINLIRFENGVRALPMEDPQEIFVAQGMREKMARFDRELADRAAERN